MLHDFGVSRRQFLQGAAAALGTLASARWTLAQEKAARPSRGQPTKFQIACMTLPYGQYPLARALSGIKSAGYEYVAWGTQHKEEGEAKSVPVMADDAPPAKAKELGQRCRDLGLAPLMMFS